METTAMMSPTRAAGPENSLALMDAARAEAIAKDVLGRLSKDVTSAAVRVEHWVGLNTTFVMNAVRRISTFNFISVNLGINITGQPVDAAGSRLYPEGFDALVRQTEALAR